jgi:putative aminopeptidase FrvX
VKNQKPIAVALAVLFFSSLTFAQESPTVSTLPEIEQEIKAVPCTSGDRLAAVKKLFMSFGAAEADITSEKIDGSTNFAVTKKGKTPETIIISAHYDKQGVGCGVIDNWTGIVMLAHLFRTYHSVDTDKTFQFVAFDDKERGLAGSKQMAKAIPKDKRVGYCAMVNFDAFGFNYPQVMDNTSSSKLRKPAEDLAKELKMPFGHSMVSEATADSTSFNDIDIPSITFHGMNPDWQKYLHTDKDQLVFVKPSSVFVGYQFMIRYLAKLDTTPCSAFRK